MIQTQGMFASDASDAADAQIPSAGLFLQSSGGTWKVCSLTNSPETENTIRFKNTYLSE